MTLLKKQPTFYLSGFVYADEWNKFGAVTSLAVIAENNMEYRIFPDDISNELKSHNWEYLEIEFVTLDKVRFGPWIKVISFSNKNDDYKEGNPSDTRNIDTSDADSMDRKDFTRFINRKKFDESEWNYRDAYYSLNREI